MKRKGNVLVSLLIILCISAGGCSGNTVKEQEQQQEVLSAENPKATEVPAVTKLPETTEIPAATEFPEPTEMWF